MKATKFDKQHLLRLFFEQEISAGYSIQDYMGKPLSYYNWNGVLQLWENRLIQNENIEWWTNQLAEFKKINWK